MEKINVDFENCYGIRKLSAEFDYTRKRGSVIYAPNGNDEDFFCGSL